MRRISSPAIYPFVAIALVFASADVRADTAEALEHYIAGTQARGEGDFDAYAESMSKALSHLPGHPIVYRHIAQAHCLAGRPRPALAALGKLAATGAYFDLAGNEDFAALQGEPGFRAVVERVDENTTPLGEEAIFATMEDPLLVPEGIAFDPVDKALYLSSLRGRKIIRVGPDGKTSDFVKDRDTYFAGLGLKVDAERRTLWAVSASFAGMIGHDETNNGWSSLSAFDLATGKQTREFVLPAEGETTHNFNDLVLDASGTVYLTDAVTGALYRLEVGGEALEEFLPAGSLNGPNGIALDEEKRLLYVAQYSLDIVTVDLATKAIETLAQGEDIATFGVDGLYFHHGSLIAVQNHPALDRIARFALSADGKKIERAEILARRLPAFEEPTTGTIVDDDFVFIANSQIEIYSNMEAPVEPADLDPVVLLKLKL